MRRILVFALGLSLAACSPDDGPGDVFGPVLEIALSTIGGEQVTDSVMIAGYTIVDDGWVIQRSWNVTEQIAACDTMRAASDPDIVFGYIGCRQDDFSGTTYEIPDGGTLDVWSVHDDGSLKYLEHIPGANYDRVMIHFTDDALQVRMEAFPDPGCTFKGWQVGAPNGPYATTNSVHYHTAGDGFTEYWAYIKCDSGGGGTGGDDDDDGGGGCIICEE